MRNLKSEGEVNAFRDFLTRGGGKRALPVLVIGVLLIAIGGLFTRGDTAQKSEATLEERVGEMCSLAEGVGECRVMITYAPDGETVYAVAVICDGGESTEVRARIVEMCASLFGIGANRITVLKTQK